MKKTALCLVALLTVAGVSLAGDGIEGAWKVVKVEKLGPDGWVAEDLQPSLSIYAGGYYSSMFVPAGDDGKSEPRKLLPDGDNRTDAQTAEAYRTIVANSGSYKVSGSEIIYTVIVAKSPNFMDGGSRKRSFKVEGDTLTTENDNFRVTSKRLK